MNILSICIIGLGLYGCTAVETIINQLNSLEKVKDKIEIHLIEKNEKIFSEATIKNQNRLHMGYHYPRCKKTRDMCFTTHQLFLNKFQSDVNSSIFIPIEYNLYWVSNKSILDAETYKDIYKAHNIPVNEIIDYNERFSFIKNVNACLQTDELFINCYQLKKYYQNLFSSLMNDYKIVFHFQTNVLKLTEKEEETNNKICLTLSNQKNESYEMNFDIVIDCTNNSLKLIKTCDIEKTISFLYHKKKYDLTIAHTIVDGPFCSLYPYNLEKNIYSLTHVLHTPITVSDNFDLNQKQIKMEQTLQEYYPSFLDDYERTNDYFISQKVKPNTFQKNVDSRLLQYEFSGLKKQILSVACCKFNGIFPFVKLLEDYCCEKLKN